MTDYKELKLNFISKNQHDSFVEIGSYLESSTSFICEEIIKPEKKPTLYCSDSRNNKAMTQCKKSIFNKFDIHPKDNNKILQLMKAFCNPPINEIEKIISMLSFLLLDGDHDYECINSDRIYCSPFLKRESLVVLHYYQWVKRLKIVLEKNIKPLSSRYSILSNMLWG